MENTSRTRELLAAQYAMYPQMQIRDFFKFLHQSSFGCEHFVQDLQTATDRIKTELQQIDGELQAQTVALDGDYCRAGLGFCREGLAPDTLAKLFVLSCVSEENAQERLAEKLCVLAEMSEKGELPFDAQRVRDDIREWQTDGFAACHHSDVFRSHYAPAYRVIRNDYALFLPLFVMIDNCLRQKGKMLLAVEGGSASGKSTLAELLRKVYGCTVFHTDDFFLQPSQRTAARLAEAGGNLDRERFYSEVLSPLCAGKSVAYRRYDCASGMICDAVRYDVTPLTVAEGAYSMHPLFADCYDASVFLDIDPALQIKRIQKRNTPMLARRFFDEWIPMEKKYFETMNIPEKCTLIIPIR